MSIKNIVDNILINEKEICKIIEIFKTGSQLFISEPTDLDFIVICDGFTLSRKKYFITIEGIKYDIIIIDKEVMVKQLDFQDIVTVHRSVKVFNYFLCFRPTVYGFWNFTWDMLSYKDEYINFLKEEYPQTIGKRIIKTHKTKAWVHYYIILKIYENNSVEITPEMLEKINILYSSSGDVVSIISWIESKLKET